MNRRRASTWRAFAVTIALLLTLLPARLTQAQWAAESLLEGTQATDHLRGRLAMDPGFVVGAGYVRAIDVDPGRRLALSGDLEALIDLSSWELAFGVSARVWGRPGLDILGSAGLDLELAQNEVHTALAPGYRFTLLPGFFASGWYVAGELGLRGNIAMSVWHKEDYLAHFPEAKDGTYVTGTAYFSLGLCAGVRLFEHWFVGARFAYRVPSTLETYGPWVQPMTAGLELGGSFALF